MAELLATVSAQELREWRAFYDCEPWGWEASLYGPAINAALTANLHRDPKKHARPYTPLDFIPRPPGPVQIRPINGPALLAKFQTTFAGFAAPGKQANGSR